MSFALSRAVWAHDGIRAIRKFVLHCLADRADDKGRCWPSIADIAARCGISERCAREHVSALVEAGYLRREIRFMRSSVFHINRAKLAPTIDPAEFANTPGKKQHEHPAEFADISYQGNPKEHNHGNAHALAAGADVCLSKKQQQELPPELASIPADLLAQFAQVRRARRKPATPLPIEAAALAEEAGKAGISVAEAIAHCIRRGWATFQAAWMAGWNAPHHTEPAHLASKPAAPQPVQAQGICTPEGTREGLRKARELLSMLAPRAQPAPSC